MEKITRFSRLPGTQLRYELDSYEYESGTGSGSFTVPLNILTGTQAFPTPVNTPRPWVQPTSYGMSLTSFDWQQYILKVGYDVNGDGGIDHVDTYRYNSGYEIGGWVDNNSVGQMFQGVYPDWGINDLYRAETECLNKLAEAKASWAENLIEAKKTAASLGAAVATLTKALIAVKRGQVPKFLSVTKQAADLYLGYKFGWEPLVADVYNTVQRLKNHANQPMLMTVKRVITNDEDNFVDEGWRTAKIHCDYLTKVQITAKLRDDYTSKIFREANELGIVNPSSLTWELVPWSFLVDWVVPIGNTLDAMTATVGLDFVSGFKTRVASGRRTVVRAPYQGWNISEPNGSARATIRRHGFVREAYFGFPRPKLYYKSPFSTSHSLTALALLRQLLSKL